MSLRRSLAYKEAQKLQPKQQVLGQKLGPAARCYEAAICTMLIKEHWMLCQVLDTHEGHDTHAAAVGLRSMWHVQQHAVNKQLTVLFNELSFKQH